MAVTTMYTSHNDHAKARNNKSVLKAAGLGTYYHHTPM